MKIYTEFSNLINEQLLNLLNRNVLRVCEYKALKWAKGDEVTEE
jgi:hypothetical protein